MEIFTVDKEVILLCTPDATFACKSAVQKLEFYIFKKTFYEEKEKWNPLSFENQVPYN